MCAGKTGRKLRMKVPYRERSSEPLWPRVLRSASRGASRSVDSGTSGLGNRASKKTFRSPTLYVEGEGHVGYGAILYLEKPDGRKRPLGIAVLEDKIVQGAVVEILNAIYRKTFWDSPMGFGQDAERTTRWMR
jgi:hypothetical protein